MGMRDCFAEAESVYHRAVQASAWGHLAPEKNKTYRGTLMVASGDYGDTIVVQDRVGVPNSPWWFEAIHEFIEGVDIEPGGVVELSVTFRNYRFWLTGTRVLAS